MPLMYQLSLSIAAILAFIGAAGPAGHAAPANSNWADCSATEAPRIIRGCTAIVAGGKSIPAEQRIVALINRGIAYYERGDLERAKVDYDAAIRLDPDNAAALHNRADLGLRKGDLDGAIADYTRALRINPQLASAYNGRGNALRESGAADRAMADYDEAIKLAPRSPFAYNGRGSILRDKGEPDRAIQEFDQAVALDPKYATAFIGRANAFSDKKEWAKALADYSTAIALDPKDPTAYNNRGSAYQSSGDFAAAVRDYDAAIKLDPNRAALRFNRGLALHMKGDLALALADYSETIRRDPQFAYAYQNRALIYQVRNDLDRAIADFSRAIEINPNYGYSYLGRGTANLRKGDLRKAVEDLRQDLRLEDKEVSGYVALAEAYMRLEQYPQAGAEINTAITLDPLSSQALLLRGKIARREGNYDDAAQDYTAALALSPNLDDARKELETIKSQAAAYKVAVAEPKAAVVTKTRSLNRVALVIGNSNYDRVAQLPNARRDAETIADTLEKIGYRSVVRVKDATREELVAALRKFRDLASSADWAVIYYAGHGMEIDGVNYVVPVDARLTSDKDVPDEAVALTRFLDSIDAAQQLRLVILDACRDNPFLSRMKVSMASRSIGRGLARVEPDGSVLVAYAAKHGQVAQDGIGENSPFVKALVKRILEPGLDIRKVFGFVRDDVLASTRRLQEPFIYGTLGGDDYIVNPQ